MRTAKTHGRRAPSAPASRKADRSKGHAPSPRAWQVRGPEGPEAARAPRRRKPRILVGTASWTDPGFLADWYPPKLPAKARLGWYAQHFNLVEVNSSFYAVPSPMTTASWCEQTPAGFTFDVKLHRLLSRHSTEVRFLPRDLRGLAGHDRKALLTPRLETALVRRMLEAAAPLAAQQKLGAFLLQLSPSFSPRKHRLDELDHLLGLLSDHKVAVELRHREWVEGAQLEETISYFTTHKAALVAVDAPVDPHFMVMPGLDVVTTTRLGYLRAHGRNARGYISGRSVAERFDYQYTDSELGEIAGRALKLAGLAAETHVIFNNNKSNFAPVSARRFREIVAALGAKV